MNKRFSGLSELLSRSHSKITLLVGPPRSVSTAMALALSQSPDIHCLIHEPFSNNYSGIPISIKNMKQREFFRFFKENSSCHILIKESSNHVDGSLFREILPFCGNVLVIVRSPLLQLTSLIKMWKWIWSACPEGHFEDEIRITTKDIRKLSKNDDLEYYFINAWRTMRKYIDIIGRDKRENGAKIDKLIVLDSEISRAAPRETFMRLAQYLNIRFSPRMLSGWGKALPRNLEIDEWSGRAASSNRLFCPDREFCGFIGLPASWQKMIRRAYRDYCEILMDGPSVVQKTLTSYMRIAGMQLRSNRKLLNAAPDTCYALVESLNVLSKTKSRLRREIKKRYPQHFEVFSMLDAVIKEINEKSLKKTGMDCQNE